MGQQRIREALIRMVQTGELQALIRCQKHDRARVEFSLQDIYDVRINRRTIVIQEREVERIRRFARHRWQTFRPIALDAGRVVMDRTSGKILQVYPANARRPGVMSSRKPRLTVKVLNVLRRT